MPEDPLVLLVGRNRRNLQLLDEFLQQEGFRTMCADSLEAFDGMLAGRERVSLTLVDLAGFDRSIWDRCERLREAGVPFLVISPRQSEVVQRRSLAHGARATLVKPLAARELLQLIRSLLEE